MSKLVTAAATLLFACHLAFGQGGKAEPRQVEFKSGSAKLAGTLANGQEMEFLFAGQKDQRVTIKMANTGLFDYRVFSREADFDTEFDSSPVSTIDLPASGEYLLFVRKKMIKRPRTARFRMIISVTDRPGTADVRDGKTQY